MFIKSFTKIGSNGNDYMKWVETQFQLLTDISSDVKTSNNAIIPEIPEVCDQVKADQDVEKELTAIGENVATNKHALSTLEGSIIKLLQAIEIRKEIEDAYKKDMAVKQI